MTGPGSVGWWLLRRRRFAVVLKERGFERAALVSVDELRSLQEDRARLETYKALERWKQRMRRACEDPILPW
jgi:PHD/YefM family antitoxin component YafN of YafNO toxin-antitoxin module